MKFKLEVDMDNAAFEDPGELNRILNKVGQEAYGSRTEGRIVDSNGNKVGMWEVTK